MRFFSTDFCGNPIYSFAHARRLRRSSNNNNAIHSSVNNRSDETIRSSQNDDPTIYTRQNRIDPHSGRHVEMHIGENTRDTSTNTRKTVLSTTSRLSNELFCMITNRAWGDVILRVQKYPNEATGQDPVTQNTPLHIACRLDPPPEVILALQVTCRTPNAEGATPLHVAASHRCSAAAIEALLNVSKRIDANNKACSCNRDEDTYITYRTGSICKNKSDEGRISCGASTADLSRMGRAPIHYACMSFRGLEIDAFRILLDASLQDGNLWIEKPIAPVPQKFDMRDNFIDEEDDDLSLENEIEKETLYCSDVNDASNISEGSYHDSDTMFHNHSKSEKLSLKDKIYEQTKEPHEDLKGMNINKVQVNVMCMKDATGQTPLALLFRRYRERVRRVITTLDRMRLEQFEYDQQKMAISAAETVHSELGQLWEKTRFIVARLTEERLTRDSGDIHPCCPENQSCVEANDKFSPLSLSIETPAAVAARWSTDKNHKHIRSASDSHQNITPALPQNFEETLTLPLEQITVTGTEVLNHIASKSIENTGPNTSNAAFCVTSGSRQFRIVHASVGLTGYGCPPELIRLAISMYPHQVLEMDDDGNLPIHIAVSVASHLAPSVVGATATEQYNSYSNSTSSVAGNSVLNSDDRSIISDAAFSFFSSATVSQTINPFDKVIKMLLQQYPNAARVPHGKSGQLPLVMAVECNQRTWEDGLRTLLNAYPPALHNKKLIESAFYPNILALIANSSVGYYCEYYSSIGNNVTYNNTTSNIKHHQHTYLSTNDNRSNEIMFDFLPLRRSHQASMTNTKPRQTKQQRHRHQTCALTTLFDLIRTKPEWITMGYEDQAEE